MEAGEGCGHPLRAARLGDLALLVHPAIRWQSIEPELRRNASHLVYRRPESRALLVSRRTSCHLRCPGSGVSQGRSAVFDRCTSHVRGRRRPGPVRVAIVERGYRHFRDPPVDLQRQGGMASNALERTVTVLLIALVFVPITAWLAARRYMPRFSATATGVGFGLVVSPVSLGLYATYFLGPGILGPVGLVTGMIGLASAMFHGPPGFHITRYLGLVPPGVVEGVGHVYVELANALVWAAVYGAFGWVIDRVRRSRAS